MVGWTPNVHHTWMRVNYLQASPELRDALGKTPIRNWLRISKSWSTRIYGWHNLLVSPPGAVYNLHYDECGVHAFVVQLSGRKRVVLYPPDQSEALYGGRVDPDYPDPDLFPRFGEATGRLEGEFGPGDVAFIPSYWWHQVRTLTDSVSVLENVVDSTTVVPFVTEQLSGWLLERITQRRELSPHGTR